MAEPSRELVRKLGTFLADLTQDRPAERVHAEVLERLRDPALDLDHRLAGVYLHLKDFIPVWTAIRNGASLPATSWETVVLPTIVHFSHEHTIKANLEAATAMWLAARTAITAPAELETPAEDTFLPWDEPVLNEPPPMPRAPEPPPLPSLESRHRLLDEPSLADRPSRRWVPQATALALVAVVALFFANGTGSSGKLRAQLERPAVAEPAPIPTPAPMPTPSASPSPSPSTTTSRPAMPTPTRTTPPPAVPPSEPRDLKVESWDGQTTVTLSWKPPARPGTGGVAFYKISGADFDNKITETSETVIVPYKPNMTYTFTVRAYSHAGLQSLASNSVSVTTDPGPTEAPISHTPTPMESRRARPV